jgi:hypothetical protein
MVLLVSLETVLFSVNFGYLAVLLLVMQEFVRLDYIVAV